MTGDRPDLSLLVPGIVELLAESRRARERREYERTVERAIAEDADLDDPVADLPGPLRVPLSRRTPW